ncbi:3-oxoacyl-ACP reductase family protein [Pseudomonas sp. T1.Ur]|uniref:3-oxoacyl-ACP reductase family protein n=1 Tax=Pseudomonas sp. T1.Ur TaxID=2928704 RepID=UPI00201DEBB2|nr:3-oxoacyl-ACP reductase family protein [Pseudomonas sp. T1.Ur]MCL6701843.1 3-oxoacyl-ACP reductase FabG [Pseudomonas sp. T1.Ur]
MIITSQRFTGRTALVTGGSRGIGAAVVRRFAREGAAVAFTYSSSDGQSRALVSSIEDEGGRALAIKADSKVAQDIQRAVETTVAQFGALNILVNNAGILGLGSVDEFSVQALDDMYAVNVRAAYIAAQACSKVMSRGDRIITVGSVAGERSGFAGSSAYSMTKSALIGLVRGLALDFAPRGITVNNIQPGPTATDMNPSDAPYLEHVIGLVPLGRLGSADEIASMAAYLASDDASFVTGASLTVDGGYLA